jgi:hypothetical protein
MTTADFERAVRRVAAILPRYSTSELRLLARHLRRKHADERTSCDDDPALFAVQREIAIREELGRGQPDWATEHHVLLHVEEACLSANGRPIRWDR